jgi:hypothetical protein
MWGNHVEYVYVWWSPKSNFAEATLQSPSDFHLGRSSWAVGMAEGCDRAQRTGGPAGCVCVLWLLDAHADLTYHIIHILLAHYVLYIDR